MKRQWHIAALLIITISAFLLRIYHLDWQCLKVDEIVTMQAAQMTTTEIVRWSLSVDYNPPLYYLLAHWSSVILGGATAFSIRLPAVICGTLCIPVIYLIGEELKGKSLGLLMAAASAFWFPFFYYSQDARAYPLVMLGFVMFAWFWIRIYNGDRAFLMQVGLGACAALCFWSHYFALVPIAVMMLALLQKDWVSSISSGIWCAIFLLPEVVMFDLSQFGSRTNHGIFNVLWLTPQQIALTVTNEMLCWALVVIIPLSIWQLYRNRNAILSIFAVASVCTALVLICTAAVTATMPRYAVVATPLVLAISMFPVASYIDDTKDTARKIAVFMGFVFLLFLLHYGSIVAWLTFSICPLMAGV